MQKDNTLRPNIDEIFKKHKKLFAKAKDAAYLKEHFIQGLREVYHRRDSSLIISAEEYLNNKVKMRV